ncbi:MAG: hypothetical protein FWE86_03100 [Oscillospiraceae bacterium]|nr:hypothetical protein [Oscillospiraceae bacterium]
MYKKIIVTTALFAVVLAFPMAGIAAAAAAESPFGAALAASAAITASLDGGDPAILIQGGNEDGNRTTTRNTTTTTTATTAATTTATTAATTTATTTVTTTATTTGTTAITPTANYDGDGHPGDEDGDGHQGNEDGDGYGDGHQGDEDGNHPHFTYKATGFGTYSGMGNISADIDAPVDKFLGLYLNGGAVNPSNYTVGEDKGGGTVITLLSHYLGTMAPGDYAFTAKYPGHDVALTLRIVGNNNNTNNNNTTNETNRTDNKIENKAEAKTENNLTAPIPKTSDDPAMFLWMITMLFSAGACGLVLRQRKQG